MQNKSPHPTTQDRLNVMNEIAKYAFGGALFTSPMADVFSSRPTRVLDLACGPGWWMRDFALAFPLAQVVGLDIRPDYFVQLQMPPNCTFVEARVEDVGVLPFADNTFDYCHQMLLSPIVPVDAFPLLIQELKRITRPGGRIELCESYNWFARRGPIGKYHEQRIGDFLRKKGIDYRIAHSLDVLLADGGLQDIIEDMKSVPVGWGGTIGTYTEFVFRQTLHTFKVNIMIELGLRTDGEFDRQVDDLIRECITFKSFWNWYSASGKVVK
ncbi:S-adenosyl-L-methionine-dependent methyltransferase [Zopfochytrium polystomum]|nr:S-adenosyl-L-methionine-dependent methyltransferase [Zopfochytrium polystomum]